MDPLFLIGFPASGKTTVGRRLAARLSRRFIDLDDVIEEETGETPAALVGRSEPRFRKIEAAALRHILDEAGRFPEGIVVATGGGAAAHGDNLARMRQAGLVVTLAIDPKLAVERAGDVAARPLLARPWSGIVELAERRQPFYRQAHAVVDASLPVEQVVSAVAALATRYQALGPARRDAVLVGLGERTYPITLAASLEGALGHVRPAGRVVIITDDQVAPLWLGPLRAALGDAHAHAPVCVVPAGEGAKCFAQYQALCEALLGHGVDRDTTVVALGGGVVGDLAGFVAATVLRGLPILQVPTTLVAMTDSAIGGKTAIDTPAGKNLVGAFWQPSAVAAALDTLTTLPARQRRAGFGELWKYALLDGEAMWEAVWECAPWALQGGEAPPELIDVIRRAAAYKAQVVVQDERETAGLRVLLNLGHTLGHAIETASAGELLHGEAVALGLVAACRVSHHLTGAGCAPELEGRVVEALARTGLSADFEPYLDEKAWDALSLDKKRVTGGVRFVAIREVGRCLPITVDLTELRRILRPSATV
ncbi:MAG: 3-dehydroquinate synthase [Myxococcales bacterium]|nr:3-dehydroquinate synthase [Myxococcales bacterium]